MAGCQDTYLIKGIKALHLYLDPLYALVQLEIHLLFGLVRIMAVSELQPKGGVVSIHACTPGSICAQQRLDFRHSDAHAAVQD